MIILVTGSRELSGQQFAHGVAALKKELKNYNPTTDIILHGGADGIDKLAGKIGKDFGFRVSVNEPNYRMHGQRAPLVRDDDMVRTCNIVIAFWNGHSHGTIYTVNSAISRGKPVKLYELGLFRTRFSMPTEAIGI